jgi:hypothetical protein
MSGAELNMAQFLKSGPMESIAREGTHSAGAVTDFELP